MEMTPARSKEIVAIEIESGSSEESQSPRIKKQIKRQYSDDVVKFKALMDKIDDVEKIKQLAVDALQEYNNYWQKIFCELTAEYNMRIINVKHKQWCKNCNHESLLHCCWNTSYCSRDCQLKDWPTHKELHKLTMQHNFRHLK